MFAYEKQEQKKAFKSTVQKKETEKPVTTPNLTGIPDDTKARFENFSGFSFDDVRVHYNSDKPAQLQALAYTRGNQVYIAPGQERNLVHELGHVVQQKKGRVIPTTIVGGVAVNDDKQLEREADSVAQLKVDETIQLRAKRRHMKAIPFVDCVDISKANYHGMSAEQILYIIEKIKDLVYFNAMSTS